MDRTRTTVISILIVLGVVVILQNRESIETELLFVSVTMPLALLLLVTFLLGGCAGLLVAQVRSRRREKASK